MSSYPPYIPPADADFSNWLVNFDTLLTAAPATYGLDAPDAAAVANVTATWVAAYALAIDPGTRTSATVADKDAARAAAEVVVRPFAVSISLNSAVTNLDKTAIGVTVRSTTPTPIPAPTVAPEVGIQSAIPMLQTLTYKEPGATGKSKPFGVVGVEVFRSIGVVAATDPAQASYNGTVTKSPFRQSFAAEDQGKICTYFTRFVTRSGPSGVAQAGPWSAPLSLVVM
jgi:hypothetical protein